MFHVLTHKDAETQCSYLPEGNPWSDITDTKLGLPHQFQALVVKGGSQL